ncbi:hypothetical protein J4G37_27550 [Microvirga sp. 3-52]|nr:hypothetical protein [Microvirga sp. 3-52]
MKKLVIISAANKDIYVRVRDRIPPKEFKAQKLAPRQKLECMIETENTYGNVDIYAGEAEDKLVLIYPDHWIFTDDPVEVPRKKDEHNFLVDPPTTDECKVSGP